MVTHADFTQKFNMTAVRPEIQVSKFEHGISKLLYMITKFQRYTHVFGVRQHGETSGSTVRCLSMS